MGYQHVKEATAPRLGHRRSWLFRYSRSLLLDPRLLDRRYARLVQPMVAGKTMATVRGSGRWPVPDTGGGGPVGVELFDQYGQGLRRAGFADQLQ
jgi:hypothetical protein